MPDPAVMRKLHQTIKKVSTDVPALSYNTAIAAMMEYMNVVRRGERTAHRAEVEPLVQLISPFAPHAAEELWEMLGHSESVFDAGWPAFDASLAAGRLLSLVGLLLCILAAGKIAVLDGLPARAAVCCARASRGSPTRGGRPAVPTGTWTWPPAGASRHGGR